MTRRATLTLGAPVLAVVLAAACGTAGAARNDAVSATQSRLGTIHSATLDLRLAATVERAAGPATKPVGFDLAGRMALPAKDGELPVADLTVTRLLGDRTEKAQFVSTGTRAWTGRNGALVELHGSPLASVRGTRSGSDLGGLHLDKWIDSPHVSTSGNDTTVTGRLDVVNALGDVFRLAGTFGATDRTTFQGKDAERLRSLVKTSSVRLVTGTDDHVLRSLHWDVTFAPGKEPQVRQALADLAGAGLSFDLSLANVDKPVKVAAPAP